MESTDDQANQLDDREEVTFNPDLLELHAHCGIAKPTMSHNFEFSLLMLVLDSCVPLIILTTREANTDG